MLNKLIKCLLVCVCSFITVYPHTVVHADEPTPNYCDGCETNGYYLKGAQGGLKFSHPDAYADVGWDLFVNAQYSNGKITVHSYAPTNIYIDIKFNFSYDSPNFHLVDVKFSSSGRRLNITAYYYVSCNLRGAYYETNTVSENFTIQF